MAQRNLELLAQAADAFNRRDLEGFIAYCDPEHGELRDLGNDRVLAIGTLHVRGGGSGIETDVATAGVVTFREGRMLSFKDYGDREAALAAAGLSD